ncbi:MAG: YcxB family protein [Thermodesulfobacteriota bacterium]
MTLEYEVTLDDLVEFNLYHFDHSRTFLRRRYLNRYGLPAMVVLALVIVTYPPTGGTFVSGFMTAGLWIAIWPRIERRATRKHITKFYREGQNKALLGKHMLQLLPDTIVETTDHGETSVSWDAVEKIVKAGDKIYVYINAVTAFVVPRRAFPTEEAFNEFFATVTKSKSQYAG